MAQHSSKTPAAAGAHTVQPKPQQPGRETGAGRSSFVDLLNGAAREGASSARAKAAAAAARGGKPLDGSREQTKSTAASASDTTASGASDSTAGSPERTSGTAAGSNAAGTTGASDGTARAASRDASSGTADGAANGAPPENDACTAQDASSGDALASIRARLAARAAAAANGQATTAAAADRTAAADDPAALAAVAAVAADTAAGGVLDALALSAGEADGLDGALDERSPDDAGGDESGAAASLLATLLQPAIRPATAATTSAAAAAGTDGDAPIAGAATSGAASLAALAHRALETTLAAATASTGTETDGTSTGTGSADAASGDASALATGAPSPTAALFDLRAAPALRHAAPVTLPVHSPVGTQAWADEVGASVRWMTEGGLQSASLRLNPEHLGPVEVRLSVQDGQTNVYFSAQHADTRAALTDALPRLREMLASQGLSLGDAGVSQQAPREQSRAPGSATARVESLTRDEPSVNAVTTRGLGLVDLYA